MIIGVGTDICENERIERLFQKFGDRFLNRIFTDAEIAYCSCKKNPIPHFSARFAVKEAFIKSLGIARDLKVSYKDVGLCGDQGKKTIVVTDELKKYFDRSGANEIIFSISHAQHYSTAFVLLEKR